MVCLVDRLESGVSLVKLRGNRFPDPANAALILPLTGYDSSGNNKRPREGRQKACGQEVVIHTALLAGI
jgi:hypothetical protein